MLVRFWSRLALLCCVAILLEVSPLQAQTTPPPTPPAVTAAVLKDTLWPPNHKMVNVGLTVTSSNFTGTATTTIAVYSNQGTSSDASWDGTDPSTLKLRATRLGNKKPGRIYLIVVTATDASGATATTVETVTVAHDQSKKTKAAIAAAAAAAQTSFETTNTPPPGFKQIL